uniref:PHD-type domain-containing protein n=1 Tax=Heliothis virescens TaxID=7102 RepID=A0A2A4IZ17_HELVI
MANNCASCQKPLRSSNIKCSKCDLLFHVACANAGNQTRLSNETKITWICPTCQNKGPKKLISPAKTVPDTGELDKTSTAACKLQQTTISPHAIPSNSNSSDSEILRSLSSEIQFLRGDVGDLKSHIKYLTEHLTQCYSRLEEYDTRIKTLEKREEQIIELNNTITNLRDQLNNQGQASLKNELEISGIDEHKNENPLHIILVMAHKIGVTLEEHDIDFVSRVGPRRPKTAASDAPIRNLAVRFVRRYKRDEFLKAAKMRRSLTSTDIDINGPTRNIFVNERLTSGNRQLFRSARNAAKEHGYKYCWIRNGAILIRKQEGCPAIHIQNMEDLERHMARTPVASAEHSAAPASRQ